MSASSQSLRFILCLRMISSFITSKPGLYVNLFNPLARLDKGLEKCTCPNLKCTSPDLKCVNFKLHVLTYCTSYALTHHTKLLLDYFFLNMHGNCFKLINNIYLKIVTLE